MSIERGGKRAGITRPSASAAGLTGGVKSPPGGREAPDGGGPVICVVTSKPVTKLFMADATGTPQGGFLGYVLACPQNCASTRPGYLEAGLDPTLSNIYLKTPEWMREVVFTDDYNAETDITKLRANYKAYRTQLTFDRVSNSPQAGGCGYMSRNVEVTKVKRQANGDLAETPLSGLYSSLAVGTAQDTFYSADEILIFRGDWVYQDPSPVKDAVDQIGTDARPTDVTGCDETLPTGIIKKPTS